MNNSKSGVVERLVKRIIKYDNSKRLDRSESKMNNILKELFVIPYQWAFWVTLLN